MKSLNAQQLAFILDIKKEDARARMCNAWCKYKGIPNETLKEGHLQIGQVAVPGAERPKGSAKVRDPYPNDMEIELLARELNLPNLQQMTDDIHENYLKRPASKRWILCDYPEKQLEKQTPKHRIKIPPALKSLLSDADIYTIKTEWRNRHGISA